MEVTETLLKRCEYAADNKDSCGTTPLMDALRAAHIDIAKLLIEKQRVDVTFRHKMINKLKMLILSTRLMQNMFTTDMHINF